MKAAILAFRKALHEHHKIILFFAFTLVVLLINSVHNSYPDEFDNILGGWSILHGKLPYRDFFSHHGPLAYFFSAVIHLISGESFVRFRIVSALFYLGTFIGTLLILQWRLKKEDTGFFFIYVPLIALASTYFWGHMFLADPLSGYMLIPGYALLLIKLYRREVLETKDLVIVSISSSLTMLMSTTYLYESLIMSLFAFISFMNTKGVALNKALFRKVFRFSVIFAGPYLLFLLYLLVTGSLLDYYNEAIIYNKNYYIYNYPRPEGSTSLNPIRYAIVIMNNFLNNFQVVLTEVTRTNFMSPFNLTMALTNLVVWITLLWKRRFTVFALSFLIIVYSTVRSNPLLSHATDYQSAVYFFLTFFHASFFFWFIARDKSTISETIEATFIKLAFIMLLLYWFFTTVFFTMELWRMSYNRYMGVMPLIYDRPQVAPIVNSVVPQDRYCWIGPFQFEELYYLNCKLPSKYDWILPQFTQSEEIKSALLSDYDKNRADVIVYQRYFGAFGMSSDYSAFFIDFLDKNYVRLHDVAPHLQFKGTKTQDFLLNEDFNFEKSRALSLIAALKEKGFIEEK